MEAEERPRHGGVLEARRPRAPRGHRTPPPTLAPHQPPRRRVRTAFASSVSRIATRPVNGYVKTSNAVRGATSPTPPRHLRPPPGHPLASPASVGGSTVPACSTPPPRRTSPLHKVSLHRRRDAAAPDPGATGFWRSSWAKTPSPPGAMRSRTPVTGGDPRSRRRGRGSRRRGHRSRRRGHRSRRRGHRSRRRGHRSRRRVMGSSAQSAGKTTHCGSSRRRGAPTRAGRGTRCALSRPKAKLHQGAVRVIYEYLNMRARRTCRREAPQPCVAGGFEVSRVPDGFCGERGCRHQATAGVGVNRPRTPLQQRGEPHRHDQPHPGKTNPEEELYARPCAHCRRIWRCSVQRHAYLLWRQIPGGL